MSSYRERRPHAALTGSVACVWTRLAGARRIVPDGCLDLVWIDGRLEMIGPDTAPRLVASDDAVAGIRLRPGTARLLLGDIPASELRDLQIDLEDLWGAAARQRVDQLSQATDHSL